MNWQTLNVKQLRIDRLNFNRRQPTLASLPFPSFPSHPLPFPSPLPAMGLGSAVSFPVGSGAKPQPLNSLVHIWAKKNGPGDNTFMDLESKHLQFSAASEWVSFVDNYHERQIKYDSFGGRPSVGGKPGPEPPGPP